jgi:hypothetical protein
VASHTNSEKVRNGDETCQTLKRKLPKYASLAQENSLDSAKLDILRWLVKGAAMMCSCRKECNG